MLLQNALIFFGLERKDGRDFAPHQWQHALQNLDKEERSPLWLQQVLVQIPQQHFSLLRQTDEDELVERLITVIDLRLKDVVELLVVAQGLRLEDAMLARLARSYLGFGG